ncbi:hypothetical protein MTO96_025925 [Rhipicephalus appendiculatus]
MLMVRRRMPLPTMSRDSSRTPLPKVGLDSSRGSGYVSRAASYQFESSPRVPRGQLGSTVQHAVRNGSLSLEAPP